MVRRVRRVPRSRARSAPFMTDSRCVNAVLDDDTHARLTQEADARKLSRAAIARAVLRLAAHDPAIIDRALAD